jgi:hypothetical protein
VCDTVRMSRRLRQGVLSCKDFRMSPHRLTANKVVTMLNLPCS